MRIYLTEKDSQAKGLVEVLGGSKGRVDGGYRAPDGALVLHAQGHLLGLADPGTYDEKLKRFAIEPLPILPESLGGWRKVLTPGDVDQRTRKLAQAVVRQLKTATEIVVATDPGREGELIARELIDHAAPKKAKVRFRLWVNALSAEAIQAALDDLRPLEEYDDLAASAEVRERLDWLIGINLSRAVTLKCAGGPQSGAILSIGRVQLPALRFVVDRDRERRAFTPTDYYEIEARVVQDGQEVVMRHVPAEQVTDRAKAEALRTRIEGGSGPLAVSKKAGRQAPPPPYNLSGLQRDAGGRHGLGAKPTLEVAQALYERKAASYPRTDGQAYQPGDYESCLQVLADLGRVLPVLGPLVPEEPVRRASVFNAKKLEGKDHWALMPLADGPAGTELTERERLVLELIARRFLQQFLPDWRFEQTRIGLVVDGLELKASGRVTVEEGWRAAGPGSAPLPGKEPEEGSEQGGLPPVVDKGRAEVVAAKLVAKKTRAPAEIAEWSLIDLLARAGIGTQATRSDTIETLKGRCYVKEGAKKKLNSTPLGEAVLDYVREHVPELADPTETAVMEQRLAKIATGELSAEKVEAFYVDYVVKAIERLKGAESRAFPIPEELKSRGGKGKTRTGAKPRSRAGPRGGAKPRSGAGGAGGAGRRT